MNTREIFFYCKDKKVFRKEESGVWWQERLNYDEELIAAMIREMKEETNLRILPNQLTYFDKLYVKYPDYDFIFHMFRTPFSRKPTVEINSREHKDFMWDNPEDALDLDLVLDADACIHLVYKIDYIRQRNRKMLEKAKTFSHLVPAAFNIIKRMPQPVGQVCGPISTGGRGSLEENLEHMSRAIDSLKIKGIIVFDQMPFQKPMRKIMNTYRDESWRMDLLKGFYLPLFESGLINTLYFLPDWKTSHGATWERTQARQLGINIVYL